MKREISGVSKNPKPTKLPLGVATPFPITENDAAGLVGGIVEKGFSEPRLLGPSSSPQPSVLPFPVARHRSHGPHWAPKPVKFNVIDDENDEDLDGMDGAANVANPVSRKEKKGLDFSHWHEIMKNDANLDPHEKKRESRLTKKVDKNGFNNLSRQIGDHAKEQTITNDAAMNDYNRSLSHDGIAKSKGSIVAEMGPISQSGSSKDVYKVSEMQSLATYMTPNFAAHKLVPKERDDLKSQIDAENRARLSKMSVDEIAEAQAEILAKFNPKLIIALKKKGQVKVIEHKVSLSDSMEANNAQPEKNQSRLNARSGSNLFHKPLEKFVGHTQVEKDNKVLSYLSDQRGSMWDAWRIRVEHARDLRFSLDGSVINTNSARVSDSGNDNVSFESGYSADNVSERDFLRTEGDPGAAGYTIKETVALTQSVVPGQRAFALRLIASVLDRAILSIFQNHDGSAIELTDWEAIWAFALGPEPELVLSLRMGLDDNHSSVVLACAKAIQSVLSCEMNEIIFDISEKIPANSKDVCTAPVFRSKPDVNAGFLRGGFWKYNTKPSNICNYSEESMDEEPENERTIQDDIVVAGQDIVAGLVRMGIIPRICYLLETDPGASLEECLISILIQIARHSPTSAVAIVKCERLLEMIANRFALKEHTEINHWKIKSVTLLKVLARVEKKNCLRFIQSGLFHKMTWQLYRYPFSLDQWLKSGKEACKLASALLVEQLRLWKVSFQYGYCLSDFSDLFNSLCIWLSVPTIDKLIEHDVMNEYFAITKEAYLLLGVLAGKLPNFYSHVNEEKKGTAKDKENCSWGHFGPIIDQALEWIDVKSIPYISRFFEDIGKSNLQDLESNSFLWVLSSVLNLFSNLLKAVISEDTNQNLEWLPDFVPQIGLKIIKNGYLRFSGLNDTKDSVVEFLYNLRRKNGQELAISSSCCLQGLIQVVASVDKLIQHTNLEIHNTPSKFINLSSEDKILANGILKSSIVEVQDLLSNSMKLITDEWQSMKPVEIFGRGGPAPGVGGGWGASNGGYWSLKTLLAQEDARLLIYLFEITEIPSPNDTSQTEGGKICLHTFEKLNCALVACLVVGPGNNSIIDQLLNFIFQVPVLKYLDIGIREFLRHRKGFKPFTWNYGEDEYILFATVLSTHFKNRWLNAKKKRKSTSKNKPNRPLETIHEDMDESNEVGEELSSLIVEWAHQGLPLHELWFLSAISTVHFEKNTEVPSDFLEVAKGGLFFLFGIEAISTFVTCCSHSPIQSVPVVWKVHALSMLLLSGMDVLEDEKSRDLYETLQNVYCETIDEKKEDDLRFVTDIHENYSIFIENLVEQFAAESYGDVIFGRQVAIYLHRSVEASVRLATWNALSNARVLELLPILDKCFMKVEGYLEHIEDDERILEAYVKSWVSGALDKAATRGSMTSSLVLHHLSSFIFGSVSGDKISLHNKLVKSLLRDYSRKQQHEGMMVKLICYKEPDMSLPGPTSEKSLSLPISEAERNLQLLRQICEGNSSLVAAVEKLESCIRRDVIGRMQ